MSQCKNLILIRKYSAYKTYKNFYEIMSYRYSNKTVASPSAVTVVNDGNSLVFFPLIYKVVR